MTRILHVFGRMERGGAQTRTLEIVRAVQKKTSVFHFLSLSGLSGELDQQVIELGGTVHYLNYRHPTFAWHFLHLLREQEIDVLHTHVFNFSGWLVWLAKLAGVQKRITHFRSSHAGLSGNWVRQQRNRVLRTLIDRYSTHILAVSVSAMSQAWRKDWQTDSRCQVIYNGLDVMAWSYDACARERVYAEFDIHTNAKLIIHVGRFAEAKNHVRLIEILAALQSEFPTEQYHLLCVGEVDDVIYPAVLQRIADKRLQKRVTFAGNRTDIQRLLSAADVMLFPSLYEGLPGAVLEASATGLSVIASNIPVIEEIKPFLPNLHPLSLATSDRVWAKIAYEQMMTNTNNDVARQVGHRQFVQTPFTLEKSIETYERLWLQSAPQNA